MPDIEVRVRVTMLVTSTTSRFSQGEIGGSFMLPSLFAFKGFEVGGLEVSAVC
jgi:hypothetical protein